MTHHDVDLDQVTIHYRQVGDPVAPPVVMLHGGGSDGGTWHRTFASLTAHGLRVIASDLRGHGRSSRTADYDLVAHARDVRRLCQVLALDPAALVGHSLGAHVASLLAQSRPEQFTRLVLEEPPAPNPRPDPTPTAGLTRRRTLLLAAGTVLRRRRYDPRALLTAIRQLREPDPGWWTALASITAPTPVISGGPGSHIRPHTLEQVARAIPRARLETIPVGHRVHSLAAERFTALVTAFLAP